MRGKNILFGTGLYLTVLFIVYGKKCINKDYGPPLTTRSQIRSYVDEYGYPYRR